MVLVFYGNDTTTGNTQQVNPSANAVLSVTTGDSVIFSASGCNPNKNVSLQSSLTPTGTFATVVTLVADSGGNVSFTSIAQNQASGTSVYYRVVSSAT